MVQVYADIAEIGHECHSGHSAAPRAHIFSRGSQRAGKRWEGPSLHVAGWD